MILNPLLGVHFRPAALTWIKHSRAIRPIIKVGKEKFQLTIDVQNFDKDEIRVKARPEYVVIEGKQERKTKRGCVMRQFVRKFKLPQGCSPENMDSKLSPDGVLTFTALRKSCESNLPCETLIPISRIEKSNNHDEPFEENGNLCSKYRDKKPDNK